MIQIVKLFIFAVFPFSQGKRQNNLQLKLTYKLSWDNLSNQ